MAQRFDPTTFSLSGETVRIADDVMRLGNGAAGFSSSMNGILVHRSGFSLADTEVDWFDRKGSVTKLSNFVPAPYGDVALDPAGRRLALSRPNPSGVGRDIVVHDIDRGTTTPLTFDSGLNFTPQWSPDGESIAFAQGEAGSRAASLLLRPSRGGEQRLLLDLNRSSGAGARLDDWSVDGQFVLYSNAEGTGLRDVFMLGVNEPRNATKLIKTAFDEKNARLSPNGRWVAYESNQAGAYQVFVHSTQDDSLYQISNIGGVQPRWRRDGKELFYMTVDGRLMAVALDQDSKGIEPGNPVELFNAHLAIPVGLSVPSRSDYDVTADGQRFAVLVPVESRVSDTASVVMNWPALLKK
jgi:Tol biopolymer transport system component